MAGMAEEVKAPLYPPEAKAERKQGTVILHAIIGRDGSIRDLKVISGPEMFRDAAVRAVQQWKYKPYRLMGRTVEVDTTITVNFRL
jgi:protein TonB